MYKQNLYNFIYDNEGQLQPLITYVCIWLFTNMYDDLLTTFWLLHMDVICLCILIKIIQRSITFVKLLFSFSNMSMMKYDLQNKLKLLAKLFNKVQAPLNGSLLAEIEKEHSSYATAMKFIG